VRLEIAAPVILEPLARTAVIEPLKSLSRSLSEVLLLSNVVTARQYAHQTEQRETRRIVAEPVAERFGAAPHLP